jgi:coenzyme F420-reducing hydrogenase gamma subunit
MRKLKVAVYKFSSCDGCQLQFLNLEDELLQLSDLIEFALFYEARRFVGSGPYDVAFVEGSISTPHEVELIKKVREESKVLVAIGACATSGGIQALRNWADAEEYKRYVYPRPEWVEVLRYAEPPSKYVKVDYEIRGCPVSKDQLLSFVLQLLKGKTPPTLPVDSVCVECKRRGNVCVLVARGIPCLGPVTMGGCGALCPSYGRGCYGCYGPMIDPKPDALNARFKELNIKPKEIQLLFKQFTNWSKEFRKVVEEYE